MRLPVTGVFHYFVTPGFVQGDYSEDRIAIAQRHWKENPRARWRRSRGHELCLAPVHWLSHHSAAQPLPCLSQPTPPGTFSLVLRPWLTLPPPSCLCSNVTFSGKVGALDLQLTLSSSSKSTAILTSLSLSGTPASHRGLCIEWVPREADAEMELGFIGV